MRDLDDDQLQAISRFADRLIPEAFERQYTAYAIARVAEDPGPFDAWVQDRIDEALTFTYPVGGRPTGMIVVERPGVRGTWHGCTYPGCRLSTESKLVNEQVAHFETPWMFAIDTWGPEEVWREVEDEDTGVIDSVLTHPQPVWRAPWYAEARGRGHATILTGAVVLDLWDRVGAQDLPPGTQLERDARRVLFRHPDRRRHRLRR